MVLAALVRLQLVMRAVEASLLADDAVVVRLRDPDGRTVAVAAAQHWRRHGLAARAVTAGLGLGVVAAVTAVLAMLVLAAVVALVAVGVPPSTAGWVGLGGVVAGAVAVLAGVARLGRIDVAGQRALRRMVCHTGGRVWGRGVVAVAPDRQGQGLGSVAVAALAQRLPSDWWWVVRAVTPHVDGFYRRVGRPLHIDGIAVQGAFVLHPTSSTVKPPSGRQRS